MSKDDHKCLISILSSLIVVVISSCINHPIIQILFIIIFFLTCYLVLSILNNKTKWKKFFLVICIVIEFIIVVYSITTIGSISSFFKHICDFFIHDEPKTPDNFNEQILGIKESIEGMNGNIIEIDKSIYMLANELGNPYVTNIDKNEVSKILQHIEETYNNYDGDFFHNLKTDPYLIELFYKMYISEESYYYCNIIQAFNEYGIDSEKYDINENDLLIWDIEILYATYNMKNSIANELKSDEIMDEKNFKYNDFRANLNRFTDTFDYGDWRRSFTECTAKQIDTWLGDAIMKYYKKLQINFSNNNL